MVVEVRVGEGRGAEGAGLVCWFMKYGGDWLRGRQARVCLSLCFGVGGKKGKVTQTRAHKHLRTPHRNAHHK